MTISSNLSTVTRNGNGVATSFSFPFKVWDVSQLDVYITDLKGATTQTSNFTATLSGSGGNVVYPAVGGAILPTGWKIVINRNMPFTQNVDLVNGQAFYPDVIEQALDELTSTCQQLDEGLSRSVKVDPGQTDPAALLTQIQAAVTNSGNSASAADLSAVSAAASAAAAQAAAETLSPATTTARGIGRVATSDDLVDGVTISNGPAFLAAGSAAVTTTPTAHAVPQADAGGKLDGWVSLAGKANNDLSNLAPAANNVIKSALNATGEAPIYACRAWVNFNGTGTVAIRASGNVSSITDNGTGDYTVNFTTAMPDANYVVNGTSRRSDTLNVKCIISLYPTWVANTNYPLATGSVRIATGYSDDGGFVDWDTNTISVFR